ncbi:MAG: S1 RNA-binding domain-containing protein, partial [Alphaproteobacteria bacterium]|nr:S1 RNA-binding domain-containing protein [Alphaproteobacteria bacterium]
IEEVTENGLAVTVAGKVRGFIRRGDLARERAEQRVERFAKGERVEAKIINLGSNDREVTLSIKALEIQEEKEAVEAYGSADSGAVLGDILGLSGIPGFESKPKGGDKAGAKAKRKPAKKPSDDADTPTTATTEAPTATSDSANASDDSTVASNDSSVASDDSSVAPSDSSVAHATGTDDAAQDATAAATPETA